MRKLAFTSRMSPCPSSLRFQNLKDMHCHLPAGTYLSTQVGSRSSWPQNHTLSISASALHFLSPFLEGLFVHLPTFCPFLKVPLMPSPLTEPSLNTPLPCIHLPSAAFSKWGYDSKRQSRAHRHEGVTAPNTADPSATPACKLALQMAQRYRTG